MTPPVPDDVLADNLRVLASFGGNQSKAADVLNISRSALQHRVRAAHRRGIFPPEQPEPVIEVETPAEAPKPVFRVRAYSIAQASSAPSINVIGIGDTHVQPGLDFQHFSWIGRYITEKKPDYVHHIGDFSEFASCDTHSQPGSYTYSQKPAFIQDIEATEEALALYHKEVGVGEIPHSITFGNHEDRVERFEEASPNLRGTLVIQRDQVFARYRWSTYAYRQYMFIGGVGFTHVPQNDFGKPVGAQESTIANGLTFSLVFGHTHRANHLTVKKYAPQNSITVTNLGSAMPFGYTPKYVEGARTGYTWGIMDMRIRSGRVESAHLISILDLKEKYE